MDTLIRPSLNNLKNNANDSLQGYPSENSASLSRPKKSIGITAQFEDLDLTPAPMLPQIVETSKYGAVAQKSFQYENAQDALQKLETQRATNR